MAEREFHITKTDRLLTVRLNVSEQSPRTRFYALLFYTAVAAAAMCVLLFASGKNGTPSMWHTMCAARVNSAGFIVPAVILLCFPILMFFLCRRYVMAAHPADETLQCDPSSLTVSKVRWLDTSNTHWDTRSYALSDIMDMHFGTIASSRGASISGLLFFARGKKQRILPGLTPRQAGIILDAMEGFGVDRGATRAGPRGRKLIS